MDGKLDLRIERTYRSLCSALARLLATRQYEDITVSDLCAEAAIRRTTFYKHFADKQAFFAFYIRSLRVEFQRRADARGGEPDRTAYIARVVHELVAFLEENDALVHNCMASAAHGALDDVLAREIAALMRELLDQEAARGCSRPCAPAPVAAEFVAGGVVHTLHCWKREHADAIPPAEIESSLCNLIGCLLG